MNPEPKRLEIFLANGESREILRVSGLTHGASDPRLGQGYRMPEKPEDIDLQLITADGKKWKAEWRLSQ